MPEFGPTNYSSQWSVENQRQIDCVLAGNPCSHWTWIQRPFVPFFPRVPITIPQSRVSQKTRKKKQHRDTEREGEKSGTSRELAFVPYCCCDEFAGARGFESCS